MTDAPGALSPLDEDGINAAVEEALAAFAAAGTLAELKEARLAHTGDASPLTWTRRTSPPPASSWAALAGASPRL